MAGQGVPAMGYAAYMETPPVTRAYATGEGQSKQFTAQLYNTCNEEVQMSLINMHPDFLTLNETDALEVIEPLVTVRSNPAVHRKAFGELTQSKNQSIKNFVVCLRSAATDCAFQCPNPACQHDLSSINIKDHYLIILDDVRCGIPPWSVN